MPRLPVQSFLRPAVLLFSGLCAGAALAQDPALDQSFAGAQLAADSDVGFRNGSVVVVPIPFTNPTIGNGLTLGAAYLFNLEASNPSGFGLGAMRSDNGSEALALGTRVNFGGGRWTLGGGVGTADVKYDLRLEDGTLVPLGQTADVLGLQASYGVNEALKLGFSLGYLDTTLRLNSRAFDGLPEELKPDANVELTKLTFNLSFDTRDDTFFPSRGTLAAVNLTLGEDADYLFDKALQVSETRYYKGFLSLAAYRPLGQRGVLAGRAVLCGAEDAAPFFDTCGVGFVDALRGFPSTEYIRDFSASVQAEYRGHIAGRVGYVLFAGAGGGGDTLGQISADAGGVAAGAGLRFRLSQQFALDYAADLAVNDQGDEYLYLSVGQRF